MLDLMKPQQIKSLRKKLGMTAQEFGECFGVRRNTVSRWEMGVRIPSHACVILMRQLAVADKKPVPA